MADIVVLGAGPTGLSAAMLLADDGHRVTVVERDAAEPNGGAHELWEAWEREGVAQFRLPHVPLPLWRAVMEQEIPEVLSELTMAGALRRNILGIGLRPPEMDGGVRPGDERFETMMARRPVLESALATVAARTAGATVRRGVRVVRLEAVDSGIAGVPRVTGVVTAAGKTIPADLVVDAGGRRSRLPAMLGALGAAAPVEERETDGFAYYSRHFRSADGTVPEFHGVPLEHFDGLSVIAVYCDSGTWSVTFVVSSRDKRLRSLRDVDTWQRTARLFPNVAHLVEGEPFDGVQVMSNLGERHRTFVVEGRPVATGVVAVGDSWACTNPSFGLGLSMGLLHACALREVVRDVPPADPEKLVRRFDEVTREQLTPAYRGITAYSRQRLAEIHADVDGVAYETDDKGYLLQRALDATMYQDPEVLRAYGDIACFLASPQEVLARPGLMEKVLTLAEAAPRYPLSGPTRAELLAAIGDA